MSVRPAPQLTPPPSPQLSPARGRLLPTEVEGNEMTNSLAGVAAANSERGPTALPKGGESSPPERREGFGLRGAGLQNGAEAFGPSHGTTE